MSVFIALKGHFHLESVYFTTAGGAIVKRLSVVHYSVVYITIQALLTLDWPSTYTLGECELYFLTRTSSILESRTWR